MFGVGSPKRCRRLWLNIRYVRFSGTGYRGSGVQHCSIWYICDVPYPLKRAVRFLVSGARFQFQCSPSCSNKRYRTEVVQARCMVADDNLHYLVSFSILRAALPPCCTCMGPRPQCNRRHCTCNNAKFLANLDGPIVPSLFVLTNPFCIIPQECVRYGNCK